MIVSKIESLEISLIGFLESNPEDKKGIDFKERMIQDIKSQLKNLRGEIVEQENDNE